MKNAQRRNLQQRGMNARKSSGQAIVEGVSILCVIILVGVMLLMMGINIYAIMLHDFKVHLVAYESARVRSESQYFLGMRRTDSSDKAVQEGSARAERTAHNLADAAGIQIRDVEFTEPDENGVTVCTVTAPMKLPFAEGVFSPFKFMDRKATGVATSSIQEPPMWVNVNSEYYPNYTSPGSNVKRNANWFVPCYGAISQGGTFNVEKNSGIITPQSMGAGLPIGAGVPVPGTMPKIPTVGVTNVGALVGGGQKADGNYAPVPGNPVDQNSHGYSDPNWNHKLF